MSEFSIKRSGLLGRQIVVFALEHASEIEFGFAGFNVRVRRQLLCHIEWFHQVGCDDDDQFRFVFLEFFALEKRTQNRNFTRRGYFEPRI